jgi:hypothetical protein
MLIHVGCIQVDFINAHLGAGFAIPMIMLDQDEMLNGGEIGRVIGSFSEWIDGLGLLDAP